MLIKLIQPRMTMRPMDTIMKPRMAPSLGLLTLATLTPPEHEIEIADENVKKLVLTDTPDLVGISANVDNAVRANAMRADFSWERTSREFLAVYEKAIEGPDGCNQIAFDPGLEELL